MRRALPLAALAALAGVASTQAPVVTTVLSNGTTQSRYDLVFLGDGYQASEQGQFDQDVLTFLAALFQKEPYATFAAYYNAHTVFRASVDSGADRPDENPPVWKNTAYNATYNFGGTDRCLYIQNTSLALADAALAPANEGRVLVMVNDSRYGGCAATFAVSYNGSLMSEVQVHELGHSLGQLADEYDYPYTNWTGGEPAAVNVTASPTGQKWAVWQGTDGISAFEGAGYYQYGLWRPRQNCLMRALGQSLCRVCQENVARVTNSIVNVITSRSPAGGSVMVAVPTPQPFAITHIVPAGNNPVIEWKLDGVPIAGATGTGYVLDPTTTAPGPHTLTASVLDQTTLVRTDPAGVMRETTTWQVTVTDPTAAQLRIPAASTSLVVVQRGSPLLLSATVVNDGPASSPPCQLEFFLSTTAAWSPLDTYLGSVAVPALGAGAQQALQHAVQLPWSLPYGALYCTAVVDRLGVVHEADENDNQRAIVMVTTTSPCSLHLEYVDPLVYPFDQQSLSTTTGGVVHPTVVAPCADPATTAYLVLWGGSGTSPGFPLGPNAHLPLNPDSLTVIGLELLNGPVFGAFFGLFDAQGLGRATFTLPPSTGLIAAPTHFAATLVGPTELFSATTNAVTLTITP